MTEIIQTLVGPFVQEWLDVHQAELKVRSKSGTAYVILKDISSGEVVTAEGPQLGAVIVEAMREYTNGGKR